MRLDKEGLQMFFRPWQIKCVKLLWTADKALGSRDVWSHLKDEASRASVINFLEAMTRYGLLEKTLVTGKGGHRGIYTAKYGEEETKKIPEKPLQTTTGKTITPKIMDPLTTCSETRPKKN